MPEQCIPIARMRVYPAGVKGYITDPGWAWYSVLARDREQWYNEDDYLYEIFELGDHVFAAPRPSPTLWDMEEVQWTQDTGTWELRYSHYGVAGLWLKGEDGDGQLTSNFYHPEGPSFCITLSAFAPPDDFAQTGDYPYLDISWGDLTAVADNRWSLRLFHDGKVGVEVVYTDGQTSFTPVGDVGWEWPKAGESDKSLTLMILHIGGGVAIKGLGGNGNWLFFQDMYGDEIWPAAGGQLQLGLHSADCNAWLNMGGVVGAFSTGNLISAESSSTAVEMYSPVMTTDQVRAGGPTVEARYVIPSVAVSEVAPDFAIEAIDHTTTDEVEVLATLTWGYAAADDGVDPLAEQAGRPLSYRFPYFPEFYASHLWFDPTVDAEEGSYTEILSEIVHAADIRMVDEGQLSDATLDITWRTGVLGDFTDYWFMRVCEVGLGWKYDDDSTSIQTVITGFVTLVDAAQLSPSLVRAQVKISDLTAALRMVECDDHWPVFDWWDVDATLEHIAMKMGLDASLYDFSSCAGLWLSYGLPEQPLWQPQPGTSAWDFLERVARYCSQELAISAAGVLSTRAMSYISGTSHTITATACLKGSPPRLERRNAFAFTGCDLRGGGHGMSELRSIVADTDAETNPAAGNFCGFRKLERYDEAGIVEQADGDALAADLYANQQVRQGDLVSWRTEGYLTAQRRNAAYLTGLAIGAIDAERLCILELGHHWGPRKKDCYTNWVACFQPEA